MVRPRLPNHRRRDYRLQIRLSEVEREQIELAARAYGESTAEFMRDITLRVIGACHGQADEAWKRTVDQ